MEQLVSILTGLGVNHSMWYQLVLFLVTFVILNNVVFKKYQSALQARHEKTLGSEDLTKQLILEAQEVQGRYEKKARQVNDQIKSAYDSALQEGQKIQASMIESVRKETAEAIKVSRENISKQVKGARADLEKELPTISALIAAKLMGKETA